MLAAIDRDFGAIDIGRLIGTEEMHHICHFLGAADPFQGHLFFDQLVCPGRQDRRGDFARCNRVDPYPGIAQFIGQLAREGR